MNPSIHSLSHRKLPTTSPVFGWFILYTMLLAFAVHSPAAVVTNNADSGPGSLRQAIIGATSGDTITFATNLTSQTIRLTSGQIQISKNLTIDASSIGGITIDGDGTVTGNRIFDLARYTTNVMTDLTLTNGLVSSLSGGAIFVDYGAILTLSNDTLVGNSANFGGGIANFGTVKLNNTTLAGNSANYGGGIYNSTDGILTTPITTSATLNQCTLANNTAGTWGGGVDNDGGWTFMTNCTVSGNTSPTGAGVQTAGDQNTETVVANSIIAGNSGGDDLGRQQTANPDGFWSGGYNLVGSGAVTNFTNTGDSTNQTVSSIQLDALGNYGGPTQTMPPLIGSPAIDAGGNTSFNNDQRGAPRFDGMTDSGAVESQSIVRNINNEGNGSLRAAIQWAPSGDTITFAPNLTSQTILLTNSQLTVNRSLTIDASAIGGITIDANGTIASGTVISNRVMEVTSNAIAVVLDSLTIIHGHSDDGDGGGISNDSSTLTINNSIISGNTTSHGRDGGGIYNYNGLLTLNNTMLSENIADGYGGGIYNSSGTLKISNSTLSGNYAYNIGGGIANDSGTLTISNSTLSGNSAINGSGGGIENNSSTLTINNSTISGNSANYDGGGIENFNSVLTINNTTLSGNYAYTGGGGIDSAYGLLILNNATLFGNSANQGGGIYNDVFSGTFMTNCTVLGNTSPNGAGVQTAGDTNTEIVVANSIIAGNLGGNDLGRDTNSNPQAYLSGGYNLIGNGTVTNFTSTGDSTNQTASLIQLAPPDNYGGPTQTMPPLPGSPAIDAGNNSVTNFFTSDQRGYPRISGAHVDIGAVEAQYAPANNPPQLAGSTFSAAGGTSTFQFSFTNSANVDFTALTSTNAALPLTNWTILGQAIQVTPGVYQFTDYGATNDPQRFYRVVSP